MFWSGMLLKASNNVWRLQNLRIAPRDLLLLTSYPESLDLVGVCNNAALFLTRKLKAPGTMRTSLHPSEKVTAQGEPLPYAHSLSHCPVASHRIGRVAM